MRTLMSFFNDKYDFSGVRENFSRLRDMAQQLAIREVIFFTKSTQNFHLQPSLKFNFVPKHDVFLVTGKDKIKSNLNVHFFLSWKKLAVCSVIQN